MFWLKWVFSFIWPIKVESIQSANGYLELVLFQGKRLLNSKNANYSNGNLQLAFANLFKEVNLGLPQRKNALILGFGFGGVAELMLQSNPNLSVIGVEYEDMILKWYRTYCKPTPQLNLIHADAATYVNQDKTQYDVIVCDLYNDLDVPDPFQSSSFIARLTQRLSKDGVLVFNKVVKTEKHRLEYNDLVLDFSTHFKQVSVNEQYNLNKFIIAQNKTK